MRERKRVYNITEDQLEQITKLLNAPQRRGFDVIEQIAEYASLYLDLPYGTSHDVAVAICSEHLKDSDLRTLPVRIDMILDDFV
jgi:hypothetical protein